ncbi:MAG TPA: oxaloacetate-decarboxylating malate dehydrogenase [Thermoanaerobaculia bacterium]|nr:oxaloacetate-decarboxylating malate dehydrogenase [Thermoanaerobaculia bacterium]
MENFTITQDACGKPRLEVPFCGTRLLRHPMYTKGTAFTRGARGLRPGRAPPARVSTLDQQSRRVYANITRKTDPLEKYIGLAALQDRNEHLFYRVLVDHVEEFLPIVYTPTVGRACQEFSHIYRRARGLWITPGHRGHISDLLGNAPFEDVRLIVVTDNERILCLGDQGAGGMGIPIGKLALYTAAAGIPPWQTLPISLDVGTDNEALLADDLYLGWRQPRLHGPEYDSLVEEFVQAVKRRFPRALLQWEDFKKNNAFRLLDRYRKVVTCFNDDIQGTAAGRALIATGSPFDPVPLEGRTITIGQGNNAFIFPGVGLGVLVSRATEVTDGMFAAASQRLADEVKPSDLASGSLFPSQSEIRRVSARIAEAVVTEARDSGVGRFLPDEGIPKAVSEAMWDPRYLPEVAAERAAVLV